MKRNFHKIKIEMKVLFAKIGFNGETVCEVEIDESVHKFSIYWIKFEYKELIKIKYQDTQSVKKWLEDLCAILGYSSIISTNMSLMDMNEIDYKYFDDIEKLDRSWAGFHNSFPTYIFEFDIVSGHGR